MKTKYFMITVMLFFTVNISFAQTLTADAGLDQAICLGQSVQIGGIPVCNGGTAPYTYLWTPSAGLSSDTLPNPIASPATATIYTIIVTDSFGSTATDAVAISVNPLPVANAGSDQTICAGSTATLNASGGVAYIWCPTYGLSNPNVPNPSVNPLTTTTYFVTITNANGCSATDDIILTITPTVDFIMNPDTAIPHHYFVTNNSSGYSPMTYLWSWGDGTTDTIAYPSHTYSATGYYNICLTITDGLMCTNTLCDSSYLNKSSKSIISVDVIPPVITNINIHESFGQIFIYPNPTNENLIIEAPQKAEIEILNFNGQIIRTYNNSGKETTIDVSDLSPGVYIIKTQTDKGVIIQKFIKQ